MQSNHVLKIRVSHLHMIVTQWPQSAGTLKQFTHLQHSNFSARDSIQFGQHRQDAVRPYSKET